MSEENSISVENRMYEKLKDLLDNGGFSFTPSDGHSILINFEPDSDMGTPISILISIIMEGRGIDLHPKTWTPNLRCRLYPTLINFV